MINHKPKHFKPLKWEDYEESAFASVKAPFKLEYHVFFDLYEGNSALNNKLYRLYSETDIHCAHISYYANPERLFSSIPEAKSYAEQHYQNVMAKLEKAIEKLKIKRQ